MILFLLFPTPDMRKSVVAFFAAASLLAACSPAQQPSDTEAMPEDGMAEDTMQDDSMKMEDDGMKMEGEAKMEAGMEVMQEEEAE